MSCLVSFTDADEACLDFLCKRTGLSKTALLRRLMWTYAKGSSSPPGLISLRTNPYPGKEHATNPS